MKTSLGAAQQRLCKAKAKLAERESELQRSKVRCRRAMTELAGSPAGLSVSAILGWVTAGRVQAWFRESGPRQRLSQGFSMSGLALFTASALRALRQVRSLQLGEQQQNHSASTENLPAS